MGKIIAAVFFINPAVRDGPWGMPASRLLSLEEHEAARREITAWPGYAPTPLRRLDGLSAALGVGRLWYKDEGERFGQGSFKALGGPYALYRIIAQQLSECAGVAEPSTAELIAGAHRELVSSLTMTCMSTGNHGRSVAWGSQMFGCRCVIFVPEWVSAGRAEAIASYGARVERLHVGYDEGIETTAERALEEGWFLISDNSKVPGTEDVAGHVMHGYTLLAAEILEQLSGEELPTHVFVPAGVGGLAAAVTGYFWAVLGERRPRIVVVESAEADCLLQSAKAGHRVRLEGALDTIMGGLACREPSPNAWEILRTGAHFFLAVPDQASIDTMRMLAAGSDGDPPIAVGESGAASPAALVQATRDPEVRRVMGLDGDARVLVIGTEGATDPDIYERIVGRSPGRVMGTRNEETR